MTTTDIADLAHHTSVAPGGEPTRASPDMVSCLAPGHEHAEQLVQALVDAGIPTTAISVVTRAELDRHPRRGEHALEDAVAGAGAGAITGSGLAWLVALGVVVLPVPGLVLVAGPLVAACLGAATGTVVGGLAGALLGLGLRSSDVSYTEKQIQQGRTWIAVNSSDAEILAEAKVVMRAWHEPAIAG